MTWKWDNPRLKASGPLSPEVIQYENLNDAFPAGKLEVWYLRPEAFRDFGSFGKSPNSNDLEATHIKLGSVAGKFDDLSGPKPAGIEWIVPVWVDDLWVKLQGDNWSPNGEARTMIRALGLRHTSMSVGDCFRFANGDVWRCESCGFTKLGAETFKSRTIKRVGQ